MTTRGVCIFRRGVTRFLVASACSDACAVAVGALQRLPLCRQQLRVAAACTRTSTSTSTSTSTTSTSTSTSTSTTCMSQLLLLLLLPAALAYPTFTDRVPNGATLRHHHHKVKDMVINCPGLGHTSCRGGGALNFFGKAFSRGGKWSKMLCEADSDGDGRTNGEELGDPRCVWQVGETPEVTERAKITHPGYNSQAKFKRPEL